MLGFKVGQESIKALIKTLHKDNCQPFVSEFIAIIVLCCFGSQIAQLRGLLLNRFSNRLIGINFLNYTIKDTSPCRCIVKGEILLYFLSNGYSFDFEIRAEAAAMSDGGHTLFVTQSEFSQVFGVCISLTYAYIIGQWLKSSLGAIKQHVKIIIDKLNHNLLIPVVKIILIG